MNMQGALGTKDHGDVQKVPHLENREKHSLQSPIRLVFQWLCGASSVPASGLGKQLINWRIS